MLAEAKVVATVTAAVTTVKVRKVTVAMPLAAAASMMAAAAATAAVVVSAAVATAADGGCGSDSFLAVLVLQVLSADSINPSGRKQAEAAGSGRKRTKVYSDNSRAYIS